MKADKVETAVKKLAVALAAIGTHGEKVEALATTLIRTVKEQGVRTLDAFDESIKGAYDLNGWNTRQGRPTAEKRGKVPHTVRTYVWEMRSALKEGVEIWDCKNFYELRVARAKLAAKAKKAAQPGHSAGDALPDLPEVTGVRLYGHEPTGALLHDLILTFVTVSKAQRALLARNLARLLAQYEHGEHRKAA